MSACDTATKKWALVDNKGEGREGNGMRSAVGATRRGMALHGMAWNDTARRRFSSLLSSHA